MSNPSQEHKTGLDKQHATKADVNNGTTAKDQPAPEKAIKPKKPTKYSYVKEGWGSRTNFQLSYGLRMTPEDLEEGNLILQAMLDSDAADEADEGDAGHGESPTNSSSV